MLPTNELPADVQRRADTFIDERMADDLSRKDALEVLAEYIELKTGEKINSLHLTNWLYGSRAIPIGKRLAITKTFSG